MTVTVKAIGHPGEPFTTMSGGTGDLQAAYRKTHQVTVDPAVRVAPPPGEDGAFSTTRLYQPTKVIRTAADGREQELPILFQGTGNFPGLGRVSARQVFYWSPEPGDTVHIKYELQQVVPSTWPERIGRLGGCLVERAVQFAQ